MFHWCRCGSAIFVLTQVLDACFFGRGGEGGGGGGEVLKTFCIERLCPDVQHRTFYILPKTELNHNEK